ncbi:MAG: ABC transporter permease, partial [Pseudomonadota bacterium]
MTARDWRAGELRLLAAALVVAVAAVTSVGFFVDRIRLGLERDATQLLGADLVLGSDQPIDDAVRQRAQADGLAIADTVTFPSMAISEANAENNALVAVKAVSRGYPLRGALRVQDRLGAPDAVTREVPAPGTVWVDPQALDVLRIAPGEALRLGDKRFVVAKLIAVEPDRG